MSQRGPTNKQLAHPQGPPLGQSQDFATGKEPESPHFLSARSFRLVDLIDRLKEDKELFLHCVQTVQDLMLPNPSFLTLDDKISTAMDFFETHDARCVAVVDIVDGSSSVENSELIGVVWRRDVARILSYGHGTPVEDERDEQTLRERLIAIVKRKPATVTPNTSVVDAIQTMLDDQVDFLPVVVDGSNLVGVLTITDIVRCFVQLDFLSRLRERVSQRPTRLIDVVRGGAKPTELLVDRFLGTIVDIMQPESEVAIHTDDPIAEAVNMMEERHLRHLLVVNRKGRVKGLISDQDIMSYLPVQPPCLFGSAQFHSSMFRIDRNDTDTAAALRVPVRHAMTGSPVTVEPTASIAEVAELFCKQSLDAVPVVSDGGRGAAQGIATNSDFLRALFGLIRLAGGDLRTGNRR